ncbi:MAG: sigma-54-dependent Fis family transcriptional regulator [Deltaproteobacteria bacterium]|nr:sigma-54-dependent Fis family transcriptional regulator [Deltaproteobacteria bacterium]
MLDSLEPSKILVVDDEPGILGSLEKILTREGFSVLTAADAEKAVEIVTSEDLDLVLTDLRLPEIDGIELTRIIRKLPNSPEVIIMTAYGNIETAVNAMKLGAYDFISKPIKKAQLLKTISKAIEKHSLVKENIRLRNLLREETATSKMVGNAESFRKTLSLLENVAKSRATVLLLGESGTGKELAANAVHQMSTQKNGKFVVLNCGALPESIIESELFGYSKGAFTGATEDRLGKIRQAQNGTLFLDEIGELKPQLQVKLLRVLQEGTVEPLGSDRSYKIDFRLVCATHRDLKTMVVEGNFREDLYYRLNVISVTLPPLRDRMDDIPLLCAHFINKFNIKNSKIVKGIDPSALDMLLSWEWPGNVRELENIIERAVVLSQGEMITPQDLPIEITREQPFRSSFEVPIGVPLEDVELRLIRETLKFTDGNKHAAARLLGITTRTIYRKLSEEELEITE